MGNCSFYSTNTLAVLPVIYNMNLLLVRCNSILDNVCNPRIAVLTEKNLNPHKLL